ncbi:MAG: hypothetical protein HLUCCA12_10450 [Rhodobacteraceae bacterium HLUCCA12]|nr:MAG: hypothetical protein HLUCCA12_10450 [Rhodobacteraceae bacterium HLUCCA12]
MACMRAEVCECMTLCEGRIDGAFEPFGAR